MRNKFIGFSALLISFSIGTLITSAFSLGMREYRQFDTLSHVQEVRDSIIYPSFDSKVTVRVREYEEYGAIVEVTNSGVSPVYLHYDEWEKARPWETYEALARPVSGGEDIPIGEGCGDCDWGFKAIAPGTSVLFKMSFLYPESPLRGEYRIGVGYLESPETVALYNKYCSDTQTSFGQNTNQINPQLLRARVEHEMRWAWADPVLLTGERVFRTNDLVIPAINELPPRPEWLMMHNERDAINYIEDILDMAEVEYRYAPLKRGRYGTVDELIAAGVLTEYQREKYGYRYHMQLLNNGQEFRLDALPVKYGVTGRYSLTLDKYGRACAADRKGLPAMKSDPSTFDYEFGFARWWNYRY